MRRGYQWLLCSVLLVFSCHAVADLSSAAFFYGENPPFEKLKHYDAVIVSPNKTIQAKQYDPRSGKLFAYVSLGEVRKDSPEAALIKQEWILGTNKIWKTYVMDESNPHWQQFFLHQLHLVASL